MCKRPRGPRGWWLLLMLLLGGCNSAGMAYLDCRHEIGEPPATLIFLPPVAIVDPAVQSWGARMDACEAQKREKM